MTRDQIITDALRKIGAIDEESTPTAAQLTVGARTLNGVLKTLAGYVGMPLWAIDETSITLTSSATYTMGIGQTVNIPRPIKILQAWRHDSTTSFDTPMQVISYEDYDRLPNKSTASGPPVNVAYQQKNGTGIFAVYPIPDTYSQSYNTIKVRYHRPFQDVTSGSETLDFPPEWNLAVVFHLAVALSPDYGVPTQDKSDLIKLATQYTEMAQATSYEDAPFTLRPDIRGK
jgi:hypothetical protein